MKVIILDFDIFGKVGGGQTSYGKLVAQNPSTDYYYLSRLATPADHPINAHPIPFEPKYLPWQPIKNEDVGFLYHRYILACQYALAIAEYDPEASYDVVDVPDYTTDGLFIRQALAAHGVTVRHVALALHGTISRAALADWAPDQIPSQITNELRVLEDIQYRIADVRYAISDAYADLWQQATGRPARKVDPLLIAGAFDPDAVVSDLGEDSVKPDLYFIGRRERGKGPDLFVDLLWAVDPLHYGNAVIVGHESTGFTGRGSTDTLKAMARERDVTFEFVDNLTPAELQTVFKDRTIVVLPSRFDTFNLVALEALRKGCPVFISREAGASRWLEETYPELADLVIDLDCSRAAALTIRNALIRYDALRQRIVQAIRAKPVTPSLLDLQSMYEPHGGSDVALRDQFDLMGEMFWRDNRPTLGRALPKDEPAVAGIAERPIEELMPDLAHEQGRHQVRLTRAMQGDLTRAGSQKQLFDPKAIDDEIRLMVGLINQHKSARIAIFDRTARLEQMRGNDLTAALYDLRIMRWMNMDHLSRLPFVTQTFEAHGFRHESAVVDAMYAEPALARDRCAEILRDQAQRSLSNPEKPLQILDDRRANAQPEVAIIVSLYNAHDKLPTLLENIANQSYAKDGRVEVVLVDSGSPGREYEVFKALADRWSLPIVFARSQGRETIQSAWNRGINLARGKYLCFLGVDEGMHPDCLEILASKLNADPSLDWVMADSIATDVTMEGVYAGDIMRYARRNYSESLVYMDTSYLSWVGGMYRKDIHDRFGYYDETFSAAGDTEFKGRVLKHLKTARVPQLLGVFNNYPEERTTQHPRAEIEDQRAWYLYRSVAGIDYIYENRSEAELLEAYRLCFDYRKCYFQHRNTDFNLAQSIAERLVRLDPGNGQYRQVLSIANQFVDRMRLVELIDPASSTQAREAIVRKALVDVHGFEALAKDIFGSDQTADFALFNDNHFEQHGWSWSG